MQDGYYIGRYRGQFCAKLVVNGKRQGRYTLGTNDRGEAERRIRELNAKRQRANTCADLTIDAIMDHYIKDREREGKIAVSRMRQCRAILRFRFGALLPRQIDKQLCTYYMTDRRNINVGDATIRTELAYLSAALQFGVDMKYIDSKPRIWRPPRGNRPPQSLPNTQ